MEGRSPSSLGTDAGINKWTFDRMISEGRPVQFFNYERLGELLNVVPSSLCYLPSYAAPRPSIAKIFAQQIERLIDKGQLPDRHVITPEGIDIVPLVLTANDPILDSLSLTDQDLRDGFRILRDDHLRVIERQTSFGYLVDGLGCVELLPRFQEEIIADIETRRLMGKFAFDLLENDSNPTHMMRIRDELPRRRVVYKQAVDADIKNVDSNGEYVVSEPHIHRVVDTDEDLRRVVYRNYRQDAAFESYFGHSRRLVTDTIRLAYEEFTAWWPPFRDENTQDILDLCDEWKKARPSFRAMELLLDRTLDRTVDQVEFLYPKTPTFYQEW